ncbi:MAG: alanyl-tRNA editing protein [Nanoarchaeota archaeon]|nr:alanyl-tRNA editing protein [Nanoarchaeota archaeon]
MEALYLKDCYLKEFGAEVTSVNGNEIELDRTAFYPESGGQLCDLGTLNNHEVVHVRKDKGRIIHEVKDHDLKAGDEVRGIIDWERRYKMMRMHTAVHVLSKVVWEDLGGEISGGQLGLEESRDDYTIPEFDREKLGQAVKKANLLIDKGAEVSFEFMPRERADKEPDLIRTKVNLIPLFVKTIRVVKIKGLDMQACAGTHVKNINEIGRIVITRAQNKGKNNRRLYFTLQ